MRLLQNFELLRCLLTCSVALALRSWAAPASDANRLNYLDGNDPFHVNLQFPKLTTPQWIGEDGVEAAVILAIDDMRDHQKYEKVLRPILERLKQIDGRAPVSIFCNSPNPAEPHLQTWLKEGVSLEVHTLAHPCPLLARSNFVAAAEAYNGCIELLNRISGNKAVAFRMPCCDSINSPSPRFYAEIFNATTPSGQFLTIDSSVMNIPTPQDESLPRELVSDANGKEKFRKYLPFASFVTTIENYPYPYVIGKLCWEFPPMVPSDWEAQHFHGTNNPATVADWKAALDISVLKQGTFTFIFHPHGWIRPEQLVEFIDYAAQKYGRKVKFLNFREAQDRLNQNLLAGNPLRAENGQDNGVRLVDLNNDGFLDVVIGNDRVRKTRLWKPQENRWTESEFPTALVENDPNRTDTGVRFGLVRPDQNVSILVRNNAVAAGWRFDGERWAGETAALAGLELDGKPVFTSQAGRDRGVRLRDVDGDGRCELIVGNESQNAVFTWSPEEKFWKKANFALPPGSSIVDESGHDNGLRFVDLNGDGFDDAIFSNEKSFSVHLFVAKPFLGFQFGWTRLVLTGQRGESGEIPMIARGGAHPNNGAWFHSRHLWVQNEETFGMPDLVDRRSYEQLLAGLQPPPSSPEASLAMIRVRPGFKVELVASEPLVQDPIAFEWGPDGRLWVVEMGDYPLGIDGKGKPGGRVKVLEDVDGDGRYDKATVFLEGLNFPTGVMPWRKGVLVSAAPEIFYAEDTDGDGKADTHRTLFTGFREGNQQHRLNGFEYGLDNWIYGANGDSGGLVRSTVIVTDPSRSTPNQTVSTASLDLRGHDFRFRPDAGLFETVEGQTQYGRHRDDWGNWFGNNNPSWGWHYFIPERYLTRNPHLLIKTLKQYIANYPESTRAFPASRNLQRFNDIGMLQHVTSGNSFTPYRDKLFGPDFANSVFISEPVHNLVHREILEADGVSFTSHRAADEQDREFLASADNWFRPTMLKTGPDGALYISDMYRLVLEHPEWIPIDTQKAIDLRAGADKGRIYRVYPVDAKLRKIPNLNRLDTAGLVAALDNANGWQRDTAQRLLVHSGDKSAIAKLENLSLKSANPKVRIQALCTLDGLGALTPKLLLGAIRSPHASVREHVIRLSEPFLQSATPRSAATPSGAKVAESEIENLRVALLKLTEDSSPRVRYQLAFTLGEWNDPRAGNALARIAVRDQSDSRIQTAVLSSAVPHLRTVLEDALTGQRSNPPISLIESLLGIAAAAGDQSVLANALQKLAEGTPAKPETWKLNVLSGFLDAVERRNQSLANYARSAAPDLRSAIEKLDFFFVSARRTALDEKAGEPDRVTSIRLLARGSSDEEADLDHLGELLLPQVTGSLQKEALSNLSRRRQQRVADLLLSHWGGLSPNLRNECLTVLLSRPEWANSLLAAIEGNQISAGQIGPVNQQKLRNHSNAKIRQHAEQLFATRADRQQLLKEYEKVVELKGDSAKGALLFRQNCATCHKFRGEGNAVGPDLAILSSKSPLVLVAAILDPNQAVDPAFVSYSATTSSGRDLSGIIVAETPGSLTLRAAGGLEETVLRSELRQLTSSGLSLMPEGLEKALSPQDMADLIQYITGPAGL